MSADDRRAIEAVTAELLAAVNGADVERVIAVWADDGVMMPPNQPAVRGRAAIEAYFRRLFERARLNFTFTESEIFIDGDTAVERVSYTVETDRGKGLHVYRRQKSGGWKLAFDIWNSDGVSTR